MAMRESPFTVAQIARAMGQTRQSVQRLVDELEREAVVERLTHPEHKRTRPVQLTERGVALYAKMVRRQAPWANRTADGIRVSVLKTALDTLRATKPARVSVPCRPLRRPPPPTRLTAMQDVYRYHVGIAGRRLYCQGVFVLDRVRVAAAQLTLRRSPNSWRSRIRPLVAWHENGNRIHLGANE